MKIRRARGVSGNLGPIRGGESGSTARDCNCCSETRQEAVQVPRGGLQLRGRDRFTADAMFLGWEGNDQAEGSVLDTAGRAVAEVDEFL